MRAEAIKLLEFFKKSPQFVTPIYLKKNSWPLGRSSARKAVLARNLQMALVRLNKEAATKIQKNFEESYI